MRRATTNILPVWGYEGISIHALHEESDWLRYGYYVQRFIFQSTLSMRRATFRTPLASVECDISIHALHEESDHETVYAPTFVGISIHALHEESDDGLHSGGRYLPISIHALHEESDRSRIRASRRRNDFNPRSP